MMLEYQYDENGNYTKKTLYNDSKSIVITEDYSYDSNGNCTKIISSDEDGNVREVEESIYDENGNILSLNHSFTYGDYGFTISYEYITMEIPVKLD